MYSRENPEKQEKWPGNMNVMVEDNANKLYRTIHCMTINDHVSRILAVCAVTINDETNVLIYLIKILVVCPDINSSRLAT
jgi:N-acetylglutamate synthase-like GNAT family acetyltransferase